MDSIRDISVLLIDPEGSTRCSLSLGFGPDKFRIQPIDSLDSALELLKRNSFDITLINCTSDKFSPPEVISKLRSQYLEMEIIALANPDRKGMSEKILQAGAFDTIDSTSGNEMLMLKLGRAAEHRKMKHQLMVLRQNIAMSCSFDNIIGVSESITKLKEQLHQVAPTDIPLLITGPPGTGKGRLARIIHCHSIRCNQPFISVDCLQTNETALNDLLFGRTDDPSSGYSNAFTAAIEKADNGTLFIEAVDQMPPSVQTRLFNFLRDFKLKTPPGINSGRIDLRIVSATANDLQYSVETGQFREDLYYRLNVVNVHIPPLCERPEDIESLVEHLLNKVIRDTGHKSLVSSPSFLDKLREYSWPGNERELETILTRAVHNCPGDRLEPGHISLDSFENHFNEKIIISNSSPKAAGNSLLENNQRSVIKKALTDNNWNFSQTAQVLGIGRTTLWRKVKKYELKKETNHK